MQWGFTIINGVALLLFVGIGSFAIYQLKAQLQQLHAKLKQIQDRMMSDQSVREKSMRLVTQLQNEVALMKKNNEQLLIAAKDDRIKEATKMVELGASVEDLVNHCDLPFGEAQLMVALNKQL